MRRAKGECYSLSSRDDKPDLHDFVFGKTKKLFVLTGQNIIAKPKKLFLFCPRSKQNTKSCRSATNPRLVVHDGVRVVHCAQSCNSVLDDLSSESVEFLFLNMAPKDLNSVLLSRNDRES